MKAGKTIGLDRIAAEFLKEVGKSLVEWLRWIFNPYINAAIMPVDQNYIQKKRGEK